jgi:hypothetical protein
MKKILGVLLLGIIASCSNAQYRIQKAQAFFTMAMPGMQMKDINGNAVDPEPIIERFIYIECKFNGKPKVDSVLYNGVFCPSVVADIAETVFAVGIKNDNNKLITVTPKKGNRIWRIDVQPTTNKPVIPAAVKKITIKGRLGKIRFSYVLTAETQLATPDRY